MRYTGTLRRFATGVALGLGVAIALRVLLKDRTRDLPDAFTAITETSWADDWNSEVDKAYDYEDSVTGRPSHWATNALPNMAQETASWQATAEILAEGPKKLRSILRARRCCPPPSAPLS